MPGCIAAALFLAIVLAVGYLARERRVAGWGCLAAGVSAFALLVGVLAALAQQWAVAAPAFTVAVGTGLVSAILVFAGFAMPSSSQREWRRRAVENAPEAERLWNGGPASLGLDDLEFVATWHADEAVREEAGAIAAGMRAKRWEQRAEENRRAAETLWWSFLEGEARRAGGRAAGAGPVPAHRGVDHYKVLGISRQATEAEITRAYRLLIAEHHPDHGGDEETAKRINEAYSTLKDPEKRRQYDLLLRYGAFG